MVGEKILLDNLVGSMEHHIHAINKILLLPPPPPLLYLCIGGQAYLTSLQQQQQHNKAKMTLLQQ